MAKEETKPHCWKDYRTYLEETNSTVEEYIETYASGNKTCFLEDGHDGEHEWTPDSEIVVTFPEAF